jgi:hypothetical protein
MEIEDTFGFLLGTWTITRSIKDHRSGLAGSFEGRAVLEPATPDPGSPLVVEAHYGEAGEFRFRGHTGPAHRSLEYVRLPSTAVMLYFPSRQPFIELDLRSGGSRTTHLCGRDHYEVSTLVLSDDLVREQWRVRGPDKAYDAVTTLVRKNRDARFDSWVPR